MIWETRTVEKPQILSRQNKAVELKTTDILTSKTQKSRQQLEETQADRELTNAQKKRQKRDKA
jgi:hypothetical protein